MALSRADRFEAEQAFADLRAAQVRKLVRAEPQHKPVMHLPRPWLMVATAFDGTRPVPVYSRARR